MAPASHKFGRKPPLSRGALLVKRIATAVYLRFCTGIPDSTSVHEPSHRRIVHFLKRQTPGSMARRDELTGKGPVAGNHVSHAHNKAKRTFDINIQKKRFYIPEENRWVTLKVSAKTIKTINKNGISAVLKKARANGINV